MDHGFINRVGGLIREDTSRETRNKLLDLFEDYIMYIKNVKSRTYESMVSLNIYMRNQFHTLYSFEHSMMLSLISTFSR